MQKLVNILLKNNLTIGSCESITGGLFASSLTNVSGVSKTFKGSLVTYQNEAKMMLLGLSCNEIEEYGVVSEYVAKAMAVMSKQLLNVDVSVSFTGNAGPETLEGKEIGLVYIGLCIKDDIKVFECHFKGSREEIRKMCIEYAKDAIINYLDGKDID